MCKHEVTAGDARALRVRPSAPHGLHLRPCHGCGNECPCLRPCPDRYPLALPLPTTKPPCTPCSIHAALQLLRVVVHGRVLPVPRVQPGAAAALQPCLCLCHARSCCRWWHARCPCPCLAYMQLLLACACCLQPCHSLWHTQNGCLSAVARGLALPVLVALRGIAPGEELLRDYSTGRPGGGMWPLPALASAWEHFWRRDSDRTAAGQAGHSPALLSEPKCSLTLT